MAPIRHRLQVTQLMTVLVILAITDLMEVHVRYVEIVELILAQQKYVMMEIQMTEMDAHNLVP